MVWNDELGKEIPKGWDVLPLGKICSKIGSGSTPRGGKGAYKKSGISLIRSLNVYDFSFAFEGLAFIDDFQAGKLDNVELKEKDILLNITGVSVARCCLIPSYVLPGRVNQHVSIIRLKPETSSVYYTLCFLCSSDSKSRLIGISQSGSTREAITKSEIEKFEILHPKINVTNIFERNMTNVFKTREVLNQQTDKMSDFKDLLLSKMAKA